LQTLLVVVISPLYAGVIARAAALLQSKRGPSVLQPYRDLGKWLRKGVVRSDQARLVFRAAPYVAMACYLTVSTIVPVITDQPLPLAFMGDLLGGALVLALAGFAMSLGAMDSGSPLGGLGASRTAWLGSLAEPALILVFFTVGVLSASDNPYLMNHAIAGSPAAMLLPTHLLGAVAFLLLILAENGHIPVESPAVTAEISMIEESRVLEYSGREYALVKWGGWMKFTVLSCVFMNVFVLPWGLGNGTSLGQGLLGCLAVSGKLALCAAVVVVVDSSFAKLRFFRIAEYLGGAFLLALIGIITSYVVAK
jgi:formate hydrogenlyase subunit 4